jgi:hypothetical protein
MSTRYRDNVLAEMATALDEIGPLETGLDLGAGDGYYALRLMERGRIRRVTPVEVQRRKHHHVEPVLYDGKTLPFADRTFDIVYAADVVHHSQDPYGTLRESARCADRFLMLKDHTYRSRAGYAMLCVLDEIGNRRFGIPSRYKYQHEFEWFPFIENLGFQLQTLLAPVRCERGLLGQVVNRLQFIAVWKRRL